ncbi:hypothetical protein AB0B25_21710 [Nocardia sp. NPDC049190]|uniref:hypothetical protein n=1 Tax=Nocardia sp. NPDC049190 TaxID=3155650 RepID=UPI0033F442E8
MSYAILYLNAQRFTDEENRTLQELRCGALAPAFGLDLGRSVIVDERDEHPWTLQEALRTGPAAIVTYSLAHIDYRPQEILTTCNLLVVKPQGWYHKGHTGFIAGMSMAPTSD